MASSPSKPAFEIIERKTETIGVGYGRCMRNHASHLGLNVLDGCGEYADMNARSLTAKSDELVCDACGCHRNFHRREVTKKISLKFVECEQASWVHFHTTTCCETGEEEVTFVENEEELIEAMKKARN